MKYQFALTSAVAAFAMHTVAFAGTAEAEKWVNEEFQPSTLSKEEQMAEMEWFIKAAEPFQEMEINILSETIPTHTYESQVLTKACRPRCRPTATSMTPTSTTPTLIGTHSRLQLGRQPDRLDGGEGKDVTLADPRCRRLHRQASFTTGPDGKLYQLPDQQFANLYWFRKDWFDREDLQGRFKEKYGYDLGVPVNWSAYEDIAEFFSTT